MHVTRYEDVGMRTNIYLKCNRCKYKNSICTTLVKPNNRLPLTKSTVSRILASESCYAVAGEQFTSIGVPFVSHVIFRKHRDRSTDLINKVTIEQMK